MGRGENFSFAGGENDDLVLSARGQTAAIMIRASCALTDGWEFLESVRQGRSIVRRLISLRIGAETVCFG